MTKRIFIGFGVITLILVGIVGLSLSFPQQICLLKGGEYFRAGFVGYGCYFKASDADKECTDTNQCQGRCEAIPLSPEQFKDSSSEGPIIFNFSSTGKCSKYKNMQFGCYTELKNGKVDKSVCVD